MKPGLRQITPDRSDYLELRSGPHQPRPCPSGLLQLRQGRDGLSRVWPRPSGTALSFAIPASQPVSVWALLWQSKEGEARDEGGVQSVILMLMVGTLLAFCGVRHALVSSCQVLTSGPDTRTYDVTQQLASWTLSGVQSSHTYDRRQPHQHHESLGHHLVHFGLDHQLPPLGDGPRRLHRRLDARRGQASPHCPLQALESQYPSQDMWLRCFQQSLLGRSTGADSLLTPT
jgi:hypothetical protein